jgi:hypothetical protein
VASEAGAAGRVVYWEVAPRRPSTTVKLASSSTAPADLTGLPLAGLETVGVGVGRQGVEPIGVVVAGGAPGDTIMTVLPDDPIRRWVDDDDPVVVVVVEKDVATGKRHAERRVVQLRRPRPWGRSATGPPRPG